MSSKLPSITFRLDPRSGVAPYRQLVDQVRHALSSGLLRAGDQLPSVREVVTQITINPNTVHRAYRELEHLGLAEGRAGLGTFITTQPSQALDVTQSNSSEEELKQRIIAMRELGVSEQRIFEIITLALRRFDDVRT